MANHSHAERQRSRITKEPVIKRFPTPKIRRFQTFYISDIARLLATLLANGHQKALKVKKDE
jgi:hypothetical protein